MTRALASTFLWCLLFSSGAAAQSQTVAEQRSFSITLYDNDLALIRDHRRVRLKKGGNTLVFPDIAGTIRPHTARLDLKTPLRIVEQNFDFDLLTPLTLTAKSLGAEITLLSPYPTDGTDRIEQGTLLAANNGVVLDIDGRIELLSGQTTKRMDFNGIPDNLRPRPTLSVIAESDRRQRVELDLLYLLTDISWQANYVVTLAEDSKSVSILGTVEITNETGSSFENAELQMVAGELNTVWDSPLNYGPPAYDWVADLFPSRPMLAANSFGGDEVDQIIITGSRVGAGVTRESLGDYYLYSLGREANLPNNQTKQFAFLSAPKVDVVQRYGFELKEVENHYYDRNNDKSLLFPVTGWLEFENTEDSGLGVPLPKGRYRLYGQRTERPAELLWGETDDDYESGWGIASIAVGQKGEYASGYSYKIYAEGKATEIDRKLLYKDKEDEDYGYFSVMTLFTYRIANHHGYDVEVNPFVLARAEEQPEIEQSSHPYERLSAREIEWSVPVPASSSVELIVTLVRELYDEMPDDDDQ